jgi:hypothetical protein
MTIPPRKSGTTLEWISWPVGPLEWMVLYVIVLFELEPYPRMTRDTFEGPGREMTVGITVSAPPALAYSGGLCEYWPADFGPLFHRAFHKRFGALRAGAQGPAGLGQEAS